MSVRKERQAELSACRCGKDVLKSNCSPLLKLFVPLRMRDELLAAIVPALVGAGAGLGWLRIPCL